MSSGFSIDTSELDAFALRLTAAAALVIPAILPSANRAGATMKAAMKADASGHTRLGGLSRTVGYDLKVSGASLDIVVGFNKSGQGNLANIAAYGTSTQGPMFDITRGIRAEAPKFAKWVSKAGTDALK